MDEGHDGAKTPFMSKRVRNGIKLLAAFLGLGLGLYLTLRLAGVMIPITLAIVIGQLLEPLIRRLMRVLPIKRSWIATVVALLMFAVLFLLIFLGIAQIVRQVGELLRDIPTLAFTVTQWLESFVNRFLEQQNRIHPGLETLLNEAASSLFQNVTTIAQRLAVALVNGVTRLPKALLYMIMTIIATVLFCAERDKLFSFAKRQLPVEWIDTALGVKNDLIGALLGYIKAQSKIMLFVAAELFIGFTILGNRYALLIAIGIALLDAFPFIGAGLVLIPLSLGSFLAGDVRVGLGVGVMYFCTIALRQMLEPRVLGDEIGLHPLLTLSSILVGYRVFGVLGMLGGPIVVLVFKNTMQVFMGGRTVAEFLDGAPRKRHEAGSDRPPDEKKKGRFRFFAKSAQKPRGDGEKHG